MGSDFKIHGGALDDGPSSVGRYQGKHKAGRVDSHANPERADPATCRYKPHIYQRYSSSATCAKTAEAVDVFH